jgi:tetratricopeptide (TPR) repeat protein
MKRFISVLFYISIGLLPIGMILRIQDFPGGGFLFTFGFLGLLIYFVAHTIKDIVKNRINRFNLSLQILIVLMSLILFSKYMYYYFGDYPGLVIIPLFILVSLIYFFKSKIRNTKLTITSIAYLILVIPLFGLEFYKSPIQYIPQAWYNRYSVEKGIPITMPYSFKYKETEELSIKAYDLYESKQYYEAIIVYEEARKIEPENPILLFGLSETYALINNLERAITLLDTAIMIDSAFPAFYNNRGLLYYKLKEHDKAVFDFKKAIQIDSTQYIYFANLALVYYRQNLFDKSCESIKKAEQLGLEIETSKSLNRIKNEKCK